jgi:hypothetical protein
MNRATRGMGTNLAIATRNAKRATAQNANRVTASRTSSKGRGKGKFTFYAWPTKKRESKKDGIEFLETFCETFKEEEDLIKKYALRDALIKVLKSKKYKTSDAMKAGVDKGIVLGVFGENGIKNAFAKARQKGADDYIKKARIALEKWRRTTINEKSIGEDYYYIPPEPR